MKLKPNTAVFKSRRFKHGTMAAIMTIGFVAVVVVVNVIASLLLERFPMEVDLTEDSIFTMTDESIDFVKQITSDVEVIFCMKEADLESLASRDSQFKQVKEIISAYAKYNSRIKMSYVDTLENPGFAREYADYSINQYSVIIKSDKDRVRVTNLSDYVLSQTNQSTGGTTYSSQAEQIMTSALMYVTDEKVTKATVLTGHNEVDVSALTSLLESNNYEVSETNIMTADQIDPEVDTALLYEPLNDYSLEELKKLDDFLSNNDNFGKTLVYVASLQGSSLPNLHAFLEEWGIEVSDGILFETDTTNVYDGRGYMMQVDVTDSDYAEGLKNPSLPVLGYYSRPLKALWENSSNRATHVLLSSRDTTVVTPTNQEELESFHLNEAEKASHPVAIVGERLRYEGTTPLRSHVAVFGGEGMFLKEILSSADFNNMDYSINLINKLNGKEDAINITPVEFKTEALKITEAQFNVLRAIFLFILPLGCAALGIVIFLRRRNR